MGYYLRWTIFLASVLLTSVDKSPAAPAYRSIQFQDGEIEQPLFQGCHLNNLSSHLIVTYRNISNRPGWEPFPHGTSVLLHCIQLGFYKLSGVSELYCQDGVWSNPVPECVPTTMLTNFTEDAPPTILFKIPSGTASVEPSGKLTVLAGTVLHLECIFPRKQGNPEWIWSSSFRQYLTGWAVATEEREWKYRLSIYFSKPQDSGVYTCTTPKGLSNSITVEVKALHCSPLDTSHDPHLIARVEGTQIGHQTSFRCLRGFKLNGHSVVTCLLSGLWSGLPPRCLPITCPSLDVDDPHLTVTEHNTSNGGRAVFRCTWGYRLTGPPDIRCQEDGHWSASIPTCEAVQCPRLSPPLNGFLVAVNARHSRVGSVVHFACKERHQLEGPGSLVCMESGQWSALPPFCKVRCPYPGDPAHGQIAPIKFWYDPGDHLKVTCNVGYVVRLEARPQCQADGFWSEEVPECRSYQDV